MRQIVLDTETTGLNPEQGHRVIEIGCVELINRRHTGNNYHQYIQPDREIDEAAVDIHGITNKFLADKPRFPEIANDFVEYVMGAELIIHNAPFDVGFINNEFRLIAEDQKQKIAQSIEDLCKVTDTLSMARALHTGQKNSLDALCKRYGIDNSQRTLHGALLDSEILADVYLIMTGGQTGLFEDRMGASKINAEAGKIQRLPDDRPPLVIQKATDEELAVHRAWVERIENQTGKKSLWSKLKLDELA